MLVAETLSKSNAAMENLDTNTRIYRGQVVWRGKWELVTRSQREASRPWRPSRPQQLWRPRHQLRRPSLPHLQQKRLAVQTHASHTGSGKQQTSHTVSHVLSRGDVRIHTRRKDKGSLDKQSEPKAQFSLC